MRNRVQQTAKDHIERLDAMANPDAQRPDEQARGQEARAAVGLPGVIDRVLSDDPAGETEVSRAPSITPSDP